MDIKRYFKKTKEKIDTALNKNLPRHRDILSKAMRYAVFSGGKRIRPIILVATAQMLGAKKEEAILPACAIELIHNFTLIHDDLPCIDNDDFRRNKPTLHKKYNEAIAVLTGDALLNYAFTILAKKGGTLNSAIKIKLIGEVSNAMGMNGLVGGQIKEIYYRNRKLSLSVIEDIYMKKTAALISAAVRMGAIVGDANQKDLSLLSDYGINIGFAFQIMDDVLEFINSETRKKKDEPNYVLLSGLEKAKYIAHEKIELAKKKLYKFGQRAEILLGIADYIIYRDH